MGNRLVYMDYNATTPLHPEVKAEMAREFDVYANASSMHEEGRRARARIEDSRSAVAELIGAAADEVIFTSGGSESNNTVFNSMLLRAAEGGRRAIVTTAIEHPCVLNSAKALQERGIPVRFLSVDRYGKIDLDELKVSVGPDTLLVSVMAANNEIGTIQDLPAIGRIAREAGALFHTDAVQAAGKIGIDVRAWGADFLTLSAHKIYGPKGVGALYVRKGIRLDPLIRGGHQERGLRAGTYNNTGILGFGLAARIAMRDGEALAARLRALRARLRDGILASVPKAAVNGHPEDVISNTLNVSFPGAEGEAILLSLDLQGIEVSTGSACASGSLEPSHVLMATGVGPELAHGSIRFSLGMGTDAADIDYVLEKLPPIIKRLRSMSTVAW
jgi:cysteine desulfurase